MENPFDGEGFSRLPLDGDDAAQHRHMLRDLSEAWPAIDEAVTLVRAVRILFNVIKFGGPVALGAAMAGAWAKSQGWL